MMQDEGKEENSIYLKLKNKSLVNAVSFLFLCICWWCDRNFHNNKKKGFFSSTTKKTL